MIQEFLDTIVAPITGLQKAAVAVVRISGPEAYPITAKLFRPWPEEPEERKVIYGKFANGDDGFALPFREGRSYTGEPSVEWSIHGSPISVRTLLDIACQSGARLAKPGEFTQRAFMNGRIDLTQAEGVRDTIESLTDAQFKAASQVREGHLFKKIQSLREEIIGVLAAVEASVDFSEEVGDLDRDAAHGRVGRALKEIDYLLATAESGRILREGLRIALIGLPNAGKSSLLNALLGMERAIVTHIPGTTRDTIEELADLGGVPCILIDTAGLRETADIVESIGVERARKAAQNANLVWYIYDASKGWTSEDESLRASLEMPCELVANKVDLGQKDSRGLPVSAKTGEGLGQLIQAVRKAASIEAQVPQVCINARHKGVLLEAKDALENVLQTLGSPVPDDLTAVGLQQALHALGEITGETATANIIERIFRDFCIGK
jgi:tRNA modification GTPase